MIRARAVVIGLLAVIVLGIITPICDLWWIGVLPGASYMPVAAIFLFFFFAFILNTILKALKVPLSPQELLLIYAMMAVASGIPSFGYALYVIGITVAPFYFATPENRYAEVLHKLIPDWLQVKNPETTARYFYEGLPGGMGIPYKDWIGPLFLWTLLALAIYLVMFCLSVIVRKQWVENEKLTFPLALVPVNMVKEKGKSSLIPAFFKNKLMWIGFLIPVIMYSMRGLHFYFPAVPMMSKSDYYFTLIEKPWNAISPINIKVALSLIGFAFLIPVSLSFSIWFFWIIHKIQVLVGASMGFPMPMVRGWYGRAFLANQEAGGMIAFAILLFWAMRRELKNMFMKIFQRGRTPEERKEGISYLLAFTGLIGGFLFVCFWAMAAGAKFWTIFLWAAIFFLTVVVITRAVAECGLFFVQYDSFPLEMVTPFTGSAAMGNQGISTLNMLNHIFPAEGRVLLMPFFLNALKMADVTKMEKRKLNVAMWLAIVLVAIVSYVMILSMAYKYGAINFNQQWWLSTYPKVCTWNSTIHYISTPVAASFMDTLNMIIGAAVTIFLFWMRRMFMWWPFHPIGYLVGARGTADRIWFMTLLGWMAKALVLKFGGIKIYRKIMPVFIGLIIGEFITVGAWVIVDLFTGAKGNFLMWM